MEFGVARRYSKGFRLRSYPGYWLSWFHPNLSSFPLLFASCMVLTLQRMSVARDTSVVLEIAYQVPLSAGIVKVLRVRYRGPVVETPVYWLGWRVAQITRFVVDRVVALIEISRTCNGRSDGFSCDGSSLFIVTWMTISRPSPWI